MQTIITKYHGHTNKRSSRISATGSARKVRRIYKYDYDLTANENHKKAAFAYAREFKWAGEWFSGELNASSEVWVMALNSHGFPACENFTVEATK